MDYTTFLFGRPSFVEGMARAFDLGGTLVELNYTNSREQADQIALTMDMRAVGQDLRREMERFANEHALVLPDGSPR